MTNKGKTATKVVKRPARLDIVDMPRDKTRALGSLRQALCASFNYCRKYPLKMKVLKEVLKYTYNRIVSWEKTQAAHEESMAKLRLEDAARVVGVELDSRQSVETMTKVLEQALALSKEQTIKQTSGDSSGAKAEADKLPTEDAKPSETGQDSVSATNKQPNTQLNKANTKETK